MKNEIKKYKFTKWIKSERILHKFSVFFNFIMIKIIRKNMFIDFLKFGNDNYIYIHIKFSNNNQYRDLILKKYLLNWNEIIYFFQSKYKMEIF